MIANHSSNITRKEDFERFRNKMKKHKTKVDMA